MPSKMREIRTLGRQLVAWLLWIPLTGSLRHNRTYGELKRIQPGEAIVGLVPFSVYFGIAVWAYLFFPRDLVPIAGSMYLAGILLGGSLVMSTVVANQIIKRQHRSR